MVGMHRGITTLKNRRMPVQPRLFEASRRELSMFLRAPER
jgi:hypothetical protein